MRNTKRAIVIPAILLFALLLPTVTAELPVDQNGNRLPFAAPVGIVSPHNTTYASRSLTLNVSQTILAASNIHYYLTYSLDGVANQSIPISTRPAYEGSILQGILSGSVDLPALSEGSHWITVYERIDVTTNAAQSGTASDTVYFTVDTQNPLPIIPITISNLMVSNRCYRNTIVPTLSFTLNQSVASISYRIDEGPNSTAAAFYDPAIWGSTFNISLAKLPEGTHQAVVYVEDLAGNTYASLMITFEKTDVWTQKVAMPTARYNLGVVVVEGKIYAIGGYKTQTNGIESFCNVTGANEVYDPETDTWTQKTPMPTPLGSFGIAVYAAKIYCFGGATATEPGRTTPQATIQIYDTQTDTWETRASMPSPRADLNAQVVGDRIYLIGGTPNGTANEAYDPATDTWTTKASMPTAACNYASAVIDDKIFIIGGVTGENTYLSLNQIYDPKTDSWSTGAPLPMAVSNAAAAAISNSPFDTVYILGGTNATFPLNAQVTNQVYFPENNTWSAGATMPKDKAGLSAAVVRGTLYVIGGGHNVFMPDSGDVMHYNQLGTVLNATFEIQPLPSLSSLSPPPVSTTPSEPPNPIPSPNQTEIPDPTPTAAQATVSPAPVTTQTPTTTPSKASSNLPLQAAFGSAVTLFLAISIGALLVRRRHQDSARTCS